MYERIGQSDIATKGSDKQSHQSAWMAHWMQTNRKAAAETRNHTASRHEELDFARRDGLLLDELDAPKSAKGFGVLETKGFKILNESLRTSSKGLRNEGMHNSLSKLGEDTDEVQTSFFRDVERGKGLICHNRLNFPPKNSRDEGTSKNPIDWMKSNLPAIDNGVVASKPFHELLVESSSRVVPYRFNVEKCEVDKGKAAVSSLMSRSAAFSNNLAIANMINLEQGNCHNSLESQSDNPTLACLRETKPSLFSETPSTRGRHLQPFNEGWLQNMHKCPNIDLFPMQFIASEKTKTMKLQKFPEHVHDVETMRICTMVDSVVGMPGGCPVFAQTTHSLLITNKTDVNLSKEHENFRNTRVITEINEKASNDHCGWSSFFGQGNKGLKLQALSSSTDSEGKGNTGDVKAFKVTIRNESSAETDTLDMDSLKEKNQHTGTNSTASIKVDATSSRETGIPDMNLPAGPAPASLSENACPSSSRTQSLDMDMLLAHAEQPKTKFNMNLDYSTKADPTNRWVKRLKLNSSSTQSTKSSNLGENLSHEKMSTYFSKILKNNITSSEEALDKSCDLSKEDENSSVDLAKKDAKLLLSQTWIQRWLGDESRISQKKPGNLVVCQPLSSKMELEELEKKQFPSIAAMALMGKAMNGFQPCELQKRGSFTVWNTKAFSKHTYGGV